MFIAVISVVGAAGKERQQASIWYMPYGETN